jgi:hypothetical protein
MLPRVSAVAVGCGEETARVAPHRRSARGQNGTIAAGRTGRAESARTMSGVAMMSLETGATAGTSGAKRVNLLQAGLLAAAEQGGPWHQERPDIARIEVRRNR